MAVVQQSKQPPAAIGRANAAPGGVRSNLPENQLGPALQRVQQIRIAVIIRLAARTLPISIVRGLSIGSIIEFQKSVEEPLELFANNRAIATGVCVKAGENFGLRLDQIVAPADRLQSPAC